MEKKAEEAMRSKKAPESTNIEIECLSQALLPLSGGELYITGKNFDPKMEVRIGLSHFTFRRCSYSRWKKMYVFIYQ